MREGERERARDEGGREKEQGIRERGYGEVDKQGSGGRWACERVGERKRGEEEKKGREMRDWEE